MTNRQNQACFFVNGSLAPTRESAYQGNVDCDPQDERPPAPVEQLVPYAQKLRESVRRARLRPVTPFYSQVSEVVQREVFDVLDGGQTPQRAVEDLEAALPEAFTGRRTPDQHPT